MILRTGKSWKKSGSITSWRILSVGLKKGIDIPAKSLNSILNTLWELGYDVQWMVFNSKFFGVPQNRERVFIVGNIRGTTRPEILPFREINKFSNEECENGLLQLNPNVSDAQRVYATNGVAKTLKGLGGGMGAKTGLYATRDNQTFKIRRLTPIECCRLQGFSDDWNKYGINEAGETIEISDSQRYKQMGNAVTVNVIEAIGRKLLQHSLNSVCGFYF